ncbi:MAG: HAD-IC family P-type ATPase, partial [Candidatus Diapherotrites archaeon]|nr:HAD-IC family P-type ATPase [Candidatus Diapherotrites archaeon]
MSQTRANWHGLKSTDVIGLLKTSAKGLTYFEVEKRLQQYGPNKLVRLDKVSVWKILAQQFLSFLVVLLIIAAIFSFAIGEIIDGSVIAIILILNAALGFIQEYRAERAMEALEKLASPKALVVREGKVREIGAERLVPGDIIILHEGDKIPADCYIIESFNAATMEAALTGESTLVEKKVSIQKDKPLAERANMLYMATILSRGKAKAVVVNTGMDTEVGKIAKLIQIAGPETSPLKQRMEVLGKRLGVVIVAITAA